MNRAYLRRRAGGFTLIELLMAASITVILAGIASDLFLRIQNLISMGTSNAEVTNDAAAMERVLRNDFRALNTQGFLSIRWTDQPVIDLASAKITGGVITGVTVNYPGSNFSTANPPSVVFYDPEGTGGGATATAVLSTNGNGIASINVATGGAGYSPSTIVIVGGVAADQIVFFAGGPWVTANYLVQDLTAGTNFSETALYQNTFTTDTARIYYGHLATTANPPFTIDNPWYIETIPGSPPTYELMNQATLSPWQWCLGRQAMLLTDDSTVSPGPSSASGNYYSTQSIWQTTNNTGPGNGTPSYGVQPGQNDITANCDLTLIRQSVLSNSPPAPGTPYIEASNPSTAWASETYAQRMAQACLRVYGTPLLNPTASTLNLNTLFYNTPVLVSNCSSFQILPTFDTTFTDVNRPGGAIVLAKTDASGPGGTTGKVISVIPLAGGQGYLTSNVMVNAPGAVGFSGVNAVFTATAGVLPSGGPVTVTLVSGGSGYPPNSVFPLVISGCYSSGYNLGTTNGCQTWPKLIQVTATLQDQIGTIHNYAVTDPTLPDGRLCRFTLEVPQ